MELDFANIKFSGRKRELQDIQRAFEGACLDGVGASSKFPPGCRVCLIEGPAGTGKSALVQAFRESCNGKSKRPFFCQGKFDEEEGTPFSAIVECLSHLIEHMSLVDEVELKISIHDKLSSEIRALSVILPHIKDMGKNVEGDEDCSSANTSSLGEPDVKSQWGFDRLRLAMRTFLRTVCQSRPVVFCMDDLQWMDEASLKIIQTLVADKQSRNFIFLATHREVPDDHALGRLKKQIPSDCITLIRLEDLNLASVLEVTAHLLRRDPDEVKPLAEVVHRKTHGNAFFVNHFLRLLYEKGLVFYSMPSFRWDWNLDRILSETDVSDNVLDVVSLKIQTMPGSLRTALTNAACLGATSFDVHTLFEIVHTLENQETHPEEHLGKRRGSGVSRFDLLLMTAVKEGLLDKLALPGKYKFSHDRIRESACQLLPKGDAMRRLHLHVGRQLLRLQNGNEEGTHGGERLFLVAVNHLNLGSSLMGDADERKELIHLNSQAADLAFEMVALESAVDYLRKGLDLLKTETRWNLHYEITLKLMTKLAHCMTCLGRTKEGQVAIDEILQNARSLMDKLGAYHSLIRSLTQQSKSKEAIRMSIFVLKELGVHLPRRLLKLRLAKGMINTMRLIRKTSFDDLQSLPPLDDQRLLEAAEFLSCLAEVATASMDLDYQVLAMLKSIQITLGHSSNKRAAQSFAVAGFFSAMLNDFKTAARCSEAAQKLIKNADFPIQEAEATTVLIFFVQHWRKPLHLGLEPALTARNILMDSGHNSSFLHLSMIAYASCYQHCGLRLQPLKDDLLKYQEILEDTGQYCFLGAFVPHTQLVLNLVGESDTPSVLSGRSMNLAAFLKERADNKRALEVCNVMRTILAFYFGDLDLALKVSNKLSIPFEEGPTPWLAIRFFFQGLIHFALAKKTSKRMHRRKSRVYLNKMKKFVRIGNPNCHHLKLILQAEHLSITERDEVIVQKGYNDAITTAARAGFVHDHALANELAGIYFLQRDQSWAGTYMVRASALYNDWGAFGKVKDLDAKYKEVMAQSSSVNLDNNCVSRALKGRSRMRNDTKKSVSLRSFESSSIM